MENEKLMEIKQAIVFAILMQTNDGIISKAPQYIEEKLWRCKNDPHPETMLDFSNKQLFDKWLNFWSSHVQKDDDPQ